MMLGIKEIKNKKRMELYNQGLTDKEIAKKLKNNKKTIYLWRKKNNLSANGRKSKISDNKLRKIFFYSQMDLSYNEIAKKSDCSVGSVYYWLNKSEG